MNLTPLKCKILQQFSLCRAHLLYCCALILEIVSESVNHSWSFFLFFPLAVIGDMQKRSPSQQVATVRVYLTGYLEYAQQVGYFSLPNVSNGVGSNTCWVTPSSVCPFNFFFLIKSNLLHSNYCELKYITLKYEESKTKF